MKIKRLKKALLAGVNYAEGRGVVEFDAIDSASNKLLYIYRLLVHNKVIQPLPEKCCATNFQSGIPNARDHPLLK